MRMAAFGRWASARAARLGSMPSATLICGGVAAVCLWIAAALAAINEIPRDAARQADFVGANAAAGVARELERGIAQIGTALRSLEAGVGDPDVQSLGIAHRNKVLFAGAAMLPPLAFFQALDDNGDVLASLQPSEHPKNWANRDYFIVHRHEPGGDLRISRPFAAARPEDAGIAISRRMSRADGSFAGVVVYGLRLSYFRDMVARLSLGRHGAVALYRDDGVVLMRVPPDANMIGHKLAAAEPLAVAVQNGVGALAVEDPLDHVNRRFTLRRVGDSPLVVAVGLAPEDMQSGAVPGVLSVTAAGLPLVLLTLAMVLRLQQESHRRQAAEQEGRDRAGFLARISHELRAPLHGLLGHAEQLQDAEDLPSACAQRVGAILNAARLLRSVVDRLLAYWPLEARGPAHQMRLVDVPALLRQCCQIMEPEAGAKALGLACAIAADAPRAFVTDSTSLHDIVMNLLSNAVKFSSSGRVDLRYSGNQNRVWIEVADTGPGIPLEKRHRLFRQYDRLDADDPNAGGTGLGLSIVARRVRLLGGRVGHRDNHSGGSVFWVELPAGVTAEPPAGPARMVPMRVRPLRILVVDDSREHRDLAQALLIKAGHRVDAAETGAEALWLVEHEDFDVVLLDMSMPGMNGLDVARAIRALPAPRRSVPIIAVTANALAAQVERYRLAGLTDHVAKPFTATELLQAIGAATQRGARVADIAVASDGEGVPLLDQAVLTEFAGAVGGAQTACHLETLADSLQVLLAKPNDPAARDGVAELAHAIAGDAGQLGFAALSQAARRLMLAMEAADPGIEMADAGHAAATVCLAADDAVTVAGASLCSVARETLPLVRQKTESLRRAFIQPAKPS